MLTRIHTTYSIRTHTSTGRLQPRSLSSHRNVWVRRAPTPWIRQNTQRGAQRPVRSLICICIRTSGPAGLSIFEGWVQAPMGICAGALAYDRQCAHRKCRYRVNLSQEELQMHAHACCTVYVQLLTLSSSTPQLTYCSIYSTNLRCMATEALIVFRTGNRRHGGRAKQLTLCHRVC